MQNPTRREDAWLKAIGGTSPSGLDREALRVSDIAWGSAVDELDRQIDGVAWLALSPVKRVQLFQEFTLNGRRLDGRGPNDVVMPDRSVASQRLDRAGDLAVWSTISVEKLLPLSLEQAEAFWLDWITGLLVEIGHRRRLPELSEFRIV
jgi:hypothetical protein